MVWIIGDCSGAVNDGAHWLLYIRRTATYNVVGGFATPPSESLLMVEVADQRVLFTVKRAGNWDQSEIMEIGTVHFGKPGVSHLVLEATDRNTWQAVDVWNIKLAPQS